MCAKYLDWYCMFVDIAVKKFRSDQTTMQYCTSHVSDKIRSVWVARTKGFFSAVCQNILSVWRCMWSMIMKTEKLLKRVKTVQFHNCNLWVLLWLSLHPPRCVGWSWKKTIKQFQRMNICLHCGTNFPTFYLCFGRNEKIPFLTY